VRQLSGLVRVSCAGAAARRPETYCVHVPV
jgi:hypothetical protein